MRKLDARMNLDTKETPVSPPVVPPIQEQRQKYPLTNPAVPQALEKLWINCEIFKKIFNQIKSIIPEAQILTKDKSGKDCCSILNKEWGVVFPESLLKLLSQEVNPELKLEWFRLVNQKWELVLDLETIFKTQWWISYFRKMEDNSYSMTTPQTTWTFGIKS